MKALVLEREKHLSLRDIAIEETLTPHDVRIRIHTVCLCGSDVHYYQHGRIGPFVVNAPMVLGDEAAGTVVEVGGAVTTGSADRPATTAADQGRRDRAANARPDASQAERGRRTD